MTSMRAKPNQVSRRSLLRRSFMRPPTEDRNSLIGHSRVIPYLLSGPAIFMVSLLLAFPVLYAIWQSTYRAEVIGGETEFVGLQNYIDLFGDPAFLSAMNRTAIFVFGCLILGISLALVFAFALNKAGRRLRFLRGITIVPYLVSGVAAAVMFRLMFNAEFGQVNRTLEFFGIDGPEWFSTPRSPGSRRRRWF